MGRRAGPTPSTAPLTAEYRKIYEDNLKDQAAGGQGTDPTFTCLAPGMPRVMNAYAPFEIVVTPRTTHMLMDHIHNSRRIFTDGRTCPKEMLASFSGYSIGHWIDQDGDGRYDVLEVETRGLAGPRSFDSTGLPFHSDNETVITERIYLDKADKNTLFDEITVSDHALTRPWTAVKKYHRLRRQAARVARGGVRRKQPPYRDRRRALHDQRRRLADAGQEGSGAARLEIFRAVIEVGWVEPSRNPSFGHGRRGGCPMGSRRTIGRPDGRLWWRSDPAAS